MKTATEIRQEIAKRESNLPELERRVDEQRAKRQSVILDGSEKERRDSRDALRALQSDIEDEELALTSLRGRLAEAEERDRIAVKRAKYDHGKHEAERGEPLAAQAVKLRAQLNEICTELAAIDTVVRGTWDLHRELGLEKIDSPLRECESIFQANFPDQKIVARRAKEIAA